ncbi:serine/threonine-protein kinase [Neosynechococcus sphagnicola]|uniref:serine/threonine-protein kinase n=1 Tax=Neosynechococcus sphagnicola TaxID=1501145 RepID=UPI000A6C2DFC|nr:serine/threonine-protein kinase [Neosynechococcus sphagnicola]
MDLYCTRPGCPRPENRFHDLDDSATLKTVQQKYCTACGMPLILDSRYLPINLLGRGGFGAAFLGCDRRMPNQPKCVIKQLQPLGKLSPQQLALAQTLFEREGEALAHLGNHHPQIPDLLAFFPLEVQGLQPGLREEFFYLVQEYIDGQTLEAELTQQGPFSEAAIGEVLQEMLKILQFVHDQGAIHRDIKPSNIMRHRNGILYLLDFGAVKDVTKVTGTTSSTGIYSLGFAPPEQLAGNEVYPSTDLYALAVTCISLLTGKQPTELFDGYHHRWNWHSQVQVSPRLTQVLDSMLQSAPNRRPQSAAAVLAALDAGLPRSTPLTSSFPGVIPSPVPAAGVPPPEICVSAYSSRCSIEVAVLDPRTLRECRVYRV